VTVTRLGVRLLTSVTHLFRIELLFVWTVLPHTNAVAGTSIKEVCNVEAFES
jgi:hypothetical protein